MSGKSTWNIGIYTYAHRRWGFSTWRAALAGDVITWAAILWGLVG